MLCYHQLWRLGVGHDAIAVKHCDIFVIQSQTQSELTIHWLIWSVVINLIFWSALFVSLADWPEDLCCAGLSWYINGWEWTVIVLMMFSSISTLPDVFLQPQGFIGIRVPTLQAHQTSDRIFREAAGRHDHFFPAWGGRSIGITGLPYVGLSMDGGTY